MGAAMTCFSGMSFSIDPFQPDQKWMGNSSEKKKKKEKKIRLEKGSKKALFPSYYLQITWDLY